MWNMMGFIGTKDMKITVEEDEYLNYLSLGYKIIRILGNQKNSLPTKERLQEEVGYILSGHSIGYIDMNNEKNI